MCLESNKNSLTLYLRKYKKSFPLIWEYSFITLLLPIMDQILQSYF